jgi:hypothetical protein
MITLPAERRGDCTSTTSAGRAGWDLLTSLLLWMSFARAGTAKEAASADARMVAFSMMRILLG